MNKKNMNIFLVAIIAILIIVSAFYLIQNNSVGPSGYFVMSFADAPVVRNYPSSILVDETFTVTLTLNIPEGTSIIGVDEIYPTEFTLINSGDGNISTPGHIKWFDYNITPGIHTYTYSLKAPSSSVTANFSGLYKTENDLDTMQIGGLTTVVISVTEQCVDADNDKKMDYDPITCPSGNDRAIRIGKPGGGKKKWIKHRDQLNTY